MRRRLGEALLTRKLVTESQLMAALELQQRRGWRLGHALVALGFLSEDQLLDVLGTELRLEVVDVNEVEPSADALRAVRARLALEHCLIPLSIESSEGSPRVLRVAMSDPGERRIIDELSFTAEAIIEPVLAKASDIARAVVRHYKLDPEAPLPSNIGALVYARDEVPSISPGEDSEDIVVERPGGPLETELAASEDLDPIPLTRRKSLPADPTDLLPAVVRGRPPSSMPPPRTPPFSTPPLAITDDLYSSPRALDPSRSAIALEDIGPYGSPSSAFDHIFQHVLLDDAGGVVRGAEVRVLERRFFALLRLLVAKGVVDRAELLNALEDADER